MQSTSQNYNIFSQDEFEEEAESAEFALIPEKKDVQPQSMSATVPIPIPYARNDVIRLGTTPELNHVN